MSAASPKILVVEDHPDTLMVFGSFLELLGYRSVLAPHPLCALAEAANQRFDALLTDVNLPGMEGWELLKELASLGQLPPLVFSMSAGDNYIQAERSKAAGCHAHLVKPFRPGELEALLQRHLPCPVSGDGARVLEADTHYGPDRCTVRS